MANESLKTLSTLRASVRRKLDEPSAAFWSNADLTAYINEAKDRVVNEVRVVKDDFFTIRRASTDGALTILGESYTASSFAIAVGTTDYSLPPDLLELKLINVITSGYEWVRFSLVDLTTQRFREALEITENQAPSHFYADIVGSRTMVVAPLSNTALDLRLTYVRKIADLSDDTDTLEMPEPLHLAVVEYACAAAMMQDRDPNSTAYEAKAALIIAKFFSAHARQTQNPRMVSDALGAW